MSGSVPAQLAASLVFAAPLSAQAAHPMSPVGTASAQVLGTWVKAGRNLFGAGANYGKDALVGTIIAPGEYSLFIELKESNWTFVVSGWAAQPEYDPTTEQLTWELLDITDRGE